MCVCLSVRLSVWLSVKMGAEPQIESVFTYDAQTAGSPKRRKSQYMARVSERERICNIIHVQVLQCSSFQHCCICKKKHFDFNKINFSIVRKLCSYFLSLIAKEMMIKNLLAVVHLQIYHIYIWL